MLSGNGGARRTCLPAAFALHRHDRHRQRVQLCRNFIGGQVSILKDDPAYCIPKDLDNQTALTVVQAFLKSSPDVMHLTTIEAIGQAMAAAYPCAKL